VYFVSIFIVVCIHVHIDICILISDSLIIYTSINTYTFKLMCRYTFIYSSTCSCGFVYMYTNIHTYIQPYTNKYVYTDVYSYTYTCTSLCRHACVCIFIYTYEHGRIHSYSLFINARHTDFSTTEHPIHFRSILMWWVFAKTVLSLSHRSLSA